MYKPSFHHLRCQALEQIGRKAEATVECQQARDLIPPREMRSPVGIPVIGPSARRIQANSVVARRPTKRLTCANCVKSEKA
jgi:hypothetical protein